MGHGIETNDTMFSANGVVPWHGLGTVIEGIPSIEEAIVASGLDWEAEIKPLTVQINDDTTIIVPNKNAIVRKTNDTYISLGVVGKRYHIYQNSVMWDFIKAFKENIGIELETAGSLRNGATTWVLCKDKNKKEIVKNDPIEEFFLFRNSFDGTTPISCMFTNIRVVCNNTLTIAIKSASNLHTIRHTRSSEGRVKEIALALAKKKKYQDIVNTGLELMSKKQMTGSDMKTFLETVIFPKPREIEQTITNNVVSFNIKKENISAKKAETSRQNNILAVENLIETGKGADIPGVKGTAYGLYNAITEWVDHEKRSRLTKGRNPLEIKFESNIWGNSAKFKNDTFAEISKLVA
jgi:phage/plasmid-like protein (TIGR03299 family)